MSLVVLAKFLLSGCYGTVSRAPNAGPEVDTDNLSGLILEEGGQRVDFHFDSEHRWEANTLVVTMPGSSETQRYEMEEIDRFLYRDLQVVRSVALTIGSVVVGLLLVAEASDDTSW